MIKRTGGGIEVTNGEDKDLFLTYRVEATDPISKEQYRISTFYRDVGQNLEVAITKDGEEINPIRLADTESLGEDRGTIQSSIEEIADTCKQLIESGKSREEVYTLLEDR